MPVEHHDGHGHGPEQSQEPRQVIVSCLIALHGRLMFIIAALHSRGVVNAVRREDAEVHRFVTEPEDMQRGQRRQLPTNRTSTKNMRKRHQRQ